MREIEFRAWDKKDNRMKTGVESYLGSYLPPNGSIHKTHILMQYTGLKDKSGKKIFEGDIVKSIWKEHIIGEVKFGQYTDSGIGEDIYTKDRFGFYVENGDRQDTIIGLGEKVWFEVIGNIYEHKHLLND